MKITATIARYLLGALFFVFGLNGFLHFIPLPPPQGLAGQFMSALYLSGELNVIMALQLASGVLLLGNRFVPLALVLLGPIVANILLFHVFMDRAGLPMAVVVVALWAVAAFGVRQAYMGLLAARIVSPRVKTESTLTARPHPLGL